MAQDTPNLFAVNGPQVHATYASTGLGGQPSFTYQDAQRALTFTGNEIEVAESELGTTVSVPIEKTVDAGFTSFSLLVPRVRLSNGQTAHIATVGITALHRGTIDTPLLGQLDTYRTVRLSGTAAFVEF
ncbi:MAG: hypothetical protein JO046_00605 [Solirubrobacterales bacterium]|nr:hypothetical protein [Solirubrobacterales bacterium]MBV9366476.1 hypothetical protein [Solirubrobacterales bacterium]MBV9680261.1 hypothetical protein [Solirubrobacterales bacterium]